MTRKQLWTAVEEALVQDWGLCGPENRGGLCYFLSKQFDHPIPNGPSHLYDDFKHEQARLFTQMPKGKSTGEHWWTLEDAGLDPRIDVCRKLAKADRKPRTTKKGRVKK